MANFGIGIGAFADGLVRGMNLGKQIKQVRKENAADEAREKAFEDAQKERNAALEAETNRLMGIGEPPTQAGGQAPVAQPVDAGGGIAQPEQPQQPAISREEARKKAEENLGDGSDDVYRIVSNRMRDHYLKSGDIELADKWEKYAETRDARRQMRHFGNALKAASVGNHDGFIKNIRPVLEDNYGKGFEIRSATPVKTKDGTVTGYNFEILNTRTGEVTQNSMSIDDLYQVGLTMGSPEQGFNRWLASQQQREEARSKAAAEAGKIQMQTAKEIAVEREKSRLRDQEIGPLGKKIRDMRVAGIPDDVIQRVVTSETISDAYKKGASPQEAKRLIVQEMMGKYVDFRGNPTKTPQEISAMADEVVKSIYGDEAARPAAPAPQETAASPGPAARGLPILDQKTGKLIYR